MCIVQEITDITTFQNLESQWNGLLSNSAADTIFLTWEWVSNWWNSYGKERNLRLLLVREGNELVAIAPFYQQRKPIISGFLVQEIRFIGTGGDVSPDHLDIIVRKGREKEVAIGLADYLCKAGGWDALILSDVPATSLALQEFMAAAAQRGLRAVTRECAVCPYIALPSSWDEYMAGLSSNTRYNIKRRMNNLKKRFTTRYLLWEDCQGLDQAMERLAQLHTLRWEDRSSYHGFSSQEYTEFHNALARDFARKGWLYLSCLELDGRIVAMFYDYRYGGKLYYYQGGFDPEYSSHSPGLALRAHVIQGAIEQGIGEIDLLKGAYEHKYRWTSSDRKTLSHIVCANTMGGKLYHWDTVEKPALKSAIKKILPSGLVNAVRRVSKQSQAGEA